MASDSSSSSGLSVEARLQEVESSLGRIRGRMSGLEKSLDDSNKAANKAWDLLNADLRKLREDQAGSAGKMKSFKAEVRTGFKDEANVHGDFDKCLAALEAAVEKLDLKWRNGVLFSLLSSAALWTSMLNNYNKAVEPLLVKA